jgi:hypothetical protein
MATGQLFMRKRLCFSLPGNGTIRFGSKATLLVAQSAIPAAHP